MKILSTHALNCMGMVVVALMTYYREIREIPERPAATPPPHLIYWQTLLRHHVNQWEIFGGCNVQGSPVPPTNHLIQWAPKVLVGQYAESCSIKCFSRVAFLAGSVSDYPLSSRIVPKSRVCLKQQQQETTSSLWCNQSPLPPTISSHHLQLLGTFNGVFRLHTQCFLVACESPTENSDNLKMFLHVSVHVEY
jgi:hypothetical protein